jgi:hypothetical protein
VTVVEGEVASLALENNENCIKKFSAVSNLFEDIGCVLRSIFSIKSGKGERDGTLLTL